MGDAMKIVPSLTVGLLVLLGVGCTKKDNAPPPGAGAPFLDEKKEVPPHLEWNREVTSRSGGTISFRVSSQGPFAVTVVNAKGLQALKSGDKKAFDKSDLLLTADSKGPTYEGKATLPPGSS
jgi:hypothetical protein